MIGCTIGGRVDGLSSGRKAIPLSIVSTFGIRTSQFPTGYE